MPRDFDQEGSDSDIEIVEFVLEVIRAESKVQRCALGGFDDEGSDSDIEIVEDIQYIE